MRSFAKLSSILPLALVLSACAMAPAPRAGSAPGAAREPRSLADAEAQLDQAYRELGGKKGSSLSGGQADTEASPTVGASPAPNTDKAIPQAPPAPPKPPAAEAPPRDDPAPKAGAKKDRAAAEEQDEASPCRQACRAYASLRRAVDAVCRMAGDPSDKCAAARDRQKEIEGRVTSCGCSN